MTTVLRRILITAFIAILASLGVFTALLGRRPRRRVAAREEVLAPVLSSPPAPRSAGGGWGMAVGLVCLLLLLGLAGTVYESRDVLFGGASREPSGTAKPLAARSPTDAGTVQPMTRANGMTTGSVRASRTGNDSVPLRPSPSPASTAPGFDVVRIEPNGDAVIAGHATPNATVELLVDGKPAGRASANADGRFTFMPPALPTGNSEIGLRATDAQGHVQRSPANVSVVVAPSRDAKPLVAVTSPDRPTTVLSQPDRPDATQLGGATAQGRQDQRDDGEITAKRGTRLPTPDEAEAESRHGSDAGSAVAKAAPAAPTGNDIQEPNRSTAGTSTASSKPGNGSPSVEGSAAAATPPKVVAIDAQGGGKLFVTARAAAGAELRLYLNDTLIAPATVGRDGTVTFAIGHGVRAGDYKVRLDLVDPTTGKVRDRAEVPFSAPAAGHDAGVEYAAGPTVPGGSVPGNHVARREPPNDPANGPQPSSTGSLAANVPPGRATGPSEVTIPGIETARIERGDSLWRISRRVYGEGERYTLIYDANQDQIRDPDLIYPGQVLVLPNREAFGAEQAGSRD